jgi:hypothetical protein
MDFNKAKHKNDDEIILSLRNRLGYVDLYIIPYTVIVIVLGGCFIAIVMNMVGEGSDVLETMSVLACGFSFIFPLLVIISALIVSTRLKWTSYIVIHHDGLEWVRGEMSKTHIAWDMMRGLQVYRANTGGPGGRTYTVVDLKLNTMVKPQINNFIARLLYGRETNTIPLSKYTDVPTEYIDVSYESVKDRLLGLLRERKQVVNLAEFKRTDVGAKLYQYAPHLFEQTSV